MSEPVPNDPRLAVLALDRDCAEWLGASVDSARPYGVADVGGAGTQALAEAAAAAAQASGSKPGRCVLALGNGLVRQRLLSLPHLSRRDTRAALARKAAALCECEVEEVVFTALGMDDASPIADGTAARAERRWLLVAQKRAETRELQAALGRRGFKVIRIVSSQLSSIARGQRLRKDKKSACIVVSALRKQVSVGLVHDETLVNENVLEGDIRTQPSLAMSLVQEAKSFDAAWRKANRGGAVGQVVLLGLPRDRAPLFKTAVASALPNAEVILQSEEGADAAGRVEALAACTETDGLQTELTLPMPLSTRTAALLLVAIFLTLATVATVAYRPTRQAELAELERVAAANARTADLESLRTQNADARRAIERLEAMTQRNARVLAHGWDVRGVLSDVVQALGAGATLTGLELGPFEKHELRISGSASSDPARAILAVDRAVKTLESDPRYRDVKSLPAGELPTGSQPIHFDLLAHKESAP